MVNLRLNEVEMDCLQGYAHRYQMSVSDVIRESLELLSVTPVNPVN